MYNIQDKQEVTREIKRYLYEVGHALYPMMKRTTVDGIFDAETGEVVRDYQKTKGLPINGTVDYLTFLALAEDYKRVCQDLTAQDAILTGDPFPIGRGAYSDDVRVINLLLHELSDEYRSLCPVNRGGYYSAYTAAAVRELRKIFMMDISDEVDKKLYNRMLTEIDTLHRNKRQGDLKKK